MPTRKGGSRDGQFSPELPLTIEHVYLTEPEAARLLDGHRPPAR